MSIENYVPERFDELHFKVLIEVRPCAACSVLTTPNLHHRRGPFPKEYAATMEAQLFAARIRFVATYNGEGRPVCGDCSKTRALYRCELCHTEKTDEATQWSGHGRQYFLCKACYRTTPAAVWDAKVFELANAEDDGFPGCGPI